MADNELSFSTVQPDVDRISASEKVRSVGYIVYTSAPSVSCGVQTATDNTPCFILQILYNSLRNLYYVVFIVIALVGHCCEPHPSAISIIVIIIILLWYTSWQAYCKLDGDMRTMMIAVILARIRETLAQKIVAGALYQKTSVISLFMAQKCQHSCPLLRRKAE